MTNPLDDWMSTLPLWEQLIVGFASFFFTVWAIVVGFPALHKWAKKLFDDLER